MYQQPVRQTLPTAVRRRMPIGAAYLGEDQRYYYFALPAGSPQLGGFFDSLGNMFSRMVKFTPKSFTPENIYQGFINTTLTTATGGLYLAAPKALAKTMEQVGRIAVPVVLGGVAAVTLGPSLMSVLGPKITAAGGILGKDPAAVGGKLFQFVSGLSPSGQAQVAQNITPQQIADMEQSSALPASVQPLFQSAMQQSVPPAPSTGAASLYAPQPVAASSMGEFSFSPMMAAAFGLPVLFYLLSERRGH